MDREKDVPRGRSLPLLIAFGSAAVVVACGVYFLQVAVPPPPPPSLHAISTAPPPPPVVDRAPAVQAAAPPPPVADPAPTVQSLVKDATPGATPRSEPAASTPPDKGELSLYEILEVQARLKSVGLNPGPFDGVPGPLTAAAVRRYEESRGQPQTGSVDRQLLERLQQKPGRPVSAGQTGRAPRP
ncbi:MAG: peptidoglycan-binding domain-containing protein [Reyranellales bacterium]